MNGEARRFAIAAVSLTVLFVSNLYGQSASPVSSSTTTKESTTETATTAANKLNATSDKIPPAANDATTADNLTAPLDKPTKPVKTSIQENAAKPTPTPEPDFWHRDAVFGDWG